MRRQISDLAASLQWQLHQLGNENHVEPDSPPDATFTSLDDSAYSTDVSITTCISPTITALAYESTTSALDDHLGWVDWTISTDLSAMGVGLGDGTGIGGGMAGLPLLARDSDSSLSSNMKDPDAQISPSSEHAMLELAHVPAAVAAVAITDDIRADLDQIYRERVHPVLPFIYWRRYFSWNDQTNPGPARTCLRSAMRTMAAAMSASSTRFCDQLYAETNTLLHAFPPIRGKDDIAIEYIQAWLLLGHFELLRVGEHQAMLTASRCSRLVLLARLFHIDRDSSTDAALESAETTTSPSSFSHVEERRRTFWVAFCLDRLLCSRNEYPLSLQEEMVRLQRKT